MKCKFCGTLNNEGITHCSECNTMLRTKGQNTSTNGTRTLLQVVLFMFGIVGTVVLLWIILHNIFHAV